MAEGRAFNRYEQGVDPPTRRALFDVNRRIDELIVKTDLTDWVAPTLVNSWADTGGYQTIGYRKVGDLVYLRGRPTGGTAPSTAFTLPTGFRPTGTYANGPVQITSAGVVSIQSGTFANFDSVVFSVTP